LSGAEVTNTPAYNAAVFITNLENLKIGVQLKEFYHGN
jgi:hypothetical protein